MIRSIFPLLSLAMVSLITAGNRPTLSAEEPKPTQSAVPIRVMSFNIRYGTARDGDNHWDKRKDFVAETIATFEPDILGTQETIGFQRDYLAEKMPGYEVFAAGRDDGKETGEMAALYFRKDRFEKLDGGHFWLSETPKQPGSKSWDSALPRIATWVKLKDRTAKDGLPVLFLNTHFDHRGTKARLESARLIRQQLSELGKGCRIVITGDFNAAEASESYAELFADAAGKTSPIVDTFRIAHPKRGADEGTFSGFQANTISGARIDWIGCSRDWEIRSAGIDRTAKDGRTPSDHFPITAVLRATSPGERPTLRVLSYNVHHCEGTDGKLDLLRIARVIRAADPDLVALQEVDYKTKRTNGVDQTAELARLTGMHARFGKAIDHAGGEYGQAILSRFPLEAATVHKLPGMPEREQRIAVEIPVKWDGFDLTFVSTHLDHQLTTEREQQAVTLNELFAKSEKPVVLVGDFNATPESKPLVLLNEKWKVATLNPKLLTVPAGKPNRQIDYVLVRPANTFRVFKAEVIDEPVASDHRPVFVVLQLEAK